MAVEGLDTAEELVVVADVNEDLGVGLHGGIEDGEGAGGEGVGVCARRCRRSVHS